MIYKMTDVQNFLTHKDSRGKETQLSYSYLEKLGFLAENAPETLYFPRS